MDGAAALFQKRAMFTIGYVDEPVLAVKVEAGLLQIFDVYAEGMCDIDQFQVGNHDDARARATLAALSALKTELGGCLVGHILSGGNECRHFHA